MIGIILLSQSLFSQKSLVLEKIDKIVLDKSDYYSDQEVKYKISEDTIYYMIFKNKKINLYQKHIKDVESILFQIISDVPNLVFPNDFELDINSRKIYYLMNNGVISVPNIPLITEFENLDYLIQNQHVYYQVSLSKSKIVLTSCYNSYSENGEKVYAKVKVLNKNGSIEFFNEFEHDAIAFTHLPSYYFAVGRNQLVFSQALKNQFIRLDLINFKLDTIGNDLLLNDGVDVLPFNTIIGPNSIAKEVVKNSSDFAKAHDRIEGCLIIDDSTFCVIKKPKNDKMNSKRILEYYQENDKGHWNLKEIYKFKNKSISKRYHIFQFYYPSGLQFEENRVFSFAEFNIPNDVNSKFKLFKFTLKMDQLEEINHAVYVYNFK